MMPPAMPSVTPAGDPAVTGQALARWEQALPDRPGPGR